MSLIAPIALKFCTEHRDWIIKPDVVDERDLARFEFAISFGRIYYIAQYPSSPFY